jgi:hypothetical protein
MLAEYEALRNEIEWLIKEASQYQNYALGLVALLPPGFALVLDTRQAWLLVPAALFAVPAFCLLGFLFFRSHQEVYVVAAYLQQEVRPQVRAAVNSNSVWGWEEYKAAAQGKQERASRLGLLTSQRFVVMLRLLVFLLPAVVALAGLTAVFADRGPQWWVHTYTWPGAVLTGLGFLLDSAIVLLLGYWFWTRGDLARTLQLDRPASGPTVPAPGPVPPGNHGAVG